MAVNISGLFTGVKITDECTEALARKQRELWEIAVQGDTLEREMGELQGFNLALTMLGLMQEVTRTRERLLAQGEFKSPFIDW